MTMQEQEPFTLDGALEIIGKERPDLYARIDFRVMRLLAAAFDPTTGGPRAVAMGLAETLEQWLQEQEES